MRWRARGGTWKEKGGGRQRRGRENHTNKLLGETSPQPQPKQPVTQNTQLEINKNDENEEQKQ